jgi:GDP-L-fucose synthase
MSRNSNNINLESKIFVAGHKGMVGSSIHRLLTKKGYKNLIIKSRDELDLLNQHEVSEFYDSYNPDYVFVCAAKVGGIQANNTYRAQFIYQNLQIQNNLIHYASVNKVKKLLFLGSSCIYPKQCSQPIKEEYLLTGKLEKTNEPYALAKIAGINMCESYYHEYGDEFFSIMPTNIYGPNDNYDLETGHVFAALIRKMHEAKTNNKNNITIWGTGTPKREFIHVDDVAQAALFVIQSDINKFYKKGLSFLNVGSGQEISIIDLAKLIAKKINYSGDIKFDKSKPDGTPRKIIDSSKINDFGWKSNISLSKGIDVVYKNYTNSYGIKS